MADREFNVRISAETDNFSSGMRRAEGDASELGETLSGETSRGADDASESLRETTEELRRLQREAIGAAGSIGNLDSSIYSMGSSTNNATNQLDNLGSEARDTESNISELRDELRWLQRDAMGANSSINSINNGFRSTNSESRKFNREMQRLSMVLGGDVPESTQKAYKEMLKLHQEARKASRYYGKYSQEAMNARDAVNTFALGLDDATFKQIYMRSQLGLTDMQLRQQANSIKLNARMTKLMGNQTQILIQRMQGLAKHGIKPEMMLPPSTIGQFQMLNETIGASGRKIYSLSSAYRKFGASVEKVIKNYSAQKVAIREAQGDMVKYGLLLRGITAANANMAIAFPIVGLGAVYAYGAMFKAALNADKALKKLADTTGKKVLKALDPVIQAAGKFLEVALKVIGVVADWITKFNKAHPIIAKVAGAIAFLLPAMTLLLLPLQMGIGLWNGWMVAINGVWTMFGGVISMIGLASATFLVLAGVIGAVAAAFMYLWKTNDKFKNGVLKAWGTLKTKASEIFGGLSEMFMTTLPNAYKTGGIEGLFNKLSEIVGNALSNISTLIPQFLQKGSEIVTNILEGIGLYLPQAYSKSTEIITNITNGIISMLPTFVQTAITIITAWLEMVTNNIPLVLDAGVKILNALIDGISQTLPLFIETITNILSTLLDTITNNIPAILDCGIQILTALIDGIIKSLPLVIDATLEIITTFIDFISNNLPKIIDSGIKLIESLVNGIIKSLPQIIDAALKVIIALVDGIANNLPKIIDSGIKLIITLAGAIIKNTPKIVNAIGQVMLALVKGIIKAIPQVASSMGNVIAEGVAAIASGVGKFIKAGGDLVAGLAKGIGGAARSVVKAVSGVVGNAISSAKKLLGINSPSKLFMQFGEWTAEGYEIGIDRGEPKSTRAVKNFAQNSVTAFENNLSSGNMINEGALSNSYSESNIDFSKMYDVMANAFIKAIEATGMNDPKFNIDGKELTNIMSPKIARTARGW